MKPIEPIVTQKNNFASLQSEPEEDAKSSNDSEQDEDDEDESIAEAAAAKEPVTSAARRTLQLPQKYLEKLFFSNKNKNSSRQNVGSATGYSVNLSRSVRMVDSEA